MSVFLGMRGTGDWPAAYRPENYREMILRLYPNGKAPLTAIMSMLKSERTTDPHFHWFEKGLPDRTVAVTGIFSGSGLGGAAYAPAGVGTAVTGDVLSIQMSAADAVKFIAGNVILLRDASDLTISIAAKVTEAPTVNGATSYAVLVLLQDDNQSVANNLKNADTAFVVGNAYSEGSTSATGQRFDAADIYNYTQIFKNALENTRTAMQTRLRTGDDVAEAKRECLELHSIDMEMAFLFGVRSIRTGANNKPERTTKGIRNFITTNKWNVADEASGFTWLTDGEAWLDAKMEEIFRYGSMKKIMLCGSGVLTAINSLVKNGPKVQYQLQPATTSYGIEVVNLLSPHGTLALKSHPLFSIQPTLRQSGCVVDMQYIRYRYMQDTTYEPNIQANDLDGEKSQYLTEAGLELHFENAHSWMDNLGADVA